MGRPTAGSTRWQRHLSGLSKQQVTDVSFIHEAMQDSYAGHVPKGIQIALKVWAKYHVQSIRHIKVTVISIYIIDT